MAGMADMIDKLFGSMRLNDDEYEDDEYEEEEEEAVSRRRSFRAVDDDDDVRPSPRAKVTQMPRSRKSSLSGAGMEVCVIKPTTVEDSKAIVDTHSDRIISPQL